MTATMAAGTEDEILRPAETRGANCHQLPYISERKLRRIICPISSTMLAGFFRSVRLLHPSTRGPVGSFELAFEGKG